MHLRTSGNARMLKKLRNWRALSSQWSTVRVQQLDRLRLASFKSCGTQAINQHFLLLPPNHPFTSHTALPSLSHLLPDTVPRRVLSTAPKVPGAKLPAGSAPRGSRHTTCGAAPYSSRGAERQPGQRAKCELPALGPRHGQVHSKTLGLG